MFQHSGLYMGEAEIYRSSTILYRRSTFLRVCVQIIPSPAHYYICSEKKNRETGMMSFIRVVDIRPLVMFSSNGFSSSREICFEFSVLYVFAYAWRLYVCANLFIRNITSETCVALVNQSKVQSFMQKQFIDICEMNDESINSI